MSAHAWLAIVLLHASWLGTGLLLLGFLRGMRDWPLLLALPAACFAGALVHVLVLQRFVAGGGHGFPIAFVVWTLVAAGLAALPFAEFRWVRARRAARAERAARPGGGGSRAGGGVAGAGDGTAAAGSRAARVARRIDVQLALLLVPPLLLVGVQLVGLPDVSYDSVAFWNLKGAWFFHDVRLDDEVFTDARRIHANPDYPLYRPLVTLEHYAVIGADDDHAVKPGYLLQLGAGLALLYGLLRDAGGRRAALLGLGLLLWTPIVAAAAVPGSPGTTYVDVPLGLQFAASLGWLLRALRTRSAADVAAAMIAAGSAALMKNEGAIWCALFVPLATCALLLGWSRGRSPSAGDGPPATRPPWLALAWCLLPVAVLVAWKALAAGLVPQVYIRPPTPAQLVRLPEIAPAMAANWWRSLLDVRLWGVLGLLLLPLCVLGAVRQLRADRRRLARLLLALVLLGQFCAVLLGVMLLEIQKGGLSNWMAHAWDRLILQLVPSALLLAVALNTSRDEDEAPAAPDAVSA